VPVDVVSNPARDLFELARSGQDFDDAASEVFDEWIRQWQRRGRGRLVAEEFVWREAPAGPTRCAPIRARFGASFTFGGDGADWLNCRKCFAHRSPDPCVLYRSVDPTPGVITLNWVGELLSIEFFGLWITCVSARASNYRSIMRWDKLFDDLESQIEHELSAEELDLQAEEERLRLGRLTIRERIVAACASGVPLRTMVAPDLRLTVTPLTVGRDWFLAELVTDARVVPHFVVPIVSVLGFTVDEAAIVSTLPTSVEAVGREALSARLGMTFVLRDLCRRRTAVEITIGDARHYGTIDRVGRDHVDLARHEQGEPRRTSAVTDIMVIPLDRITLVRV
jgi:hypothetical protein